MGTRSTLLVLGFVVGVAVGIGGTLLLGGSAEPALGPAPQSSGAEALHHEIEVKVERIRALEGELERAKAELVVARSDSVPDAVLPEASAEDGTGDRPQEPVTLEQIKTSVRRFAASFQSYLVEGKTKALDELKVLLHRADHATMEELIEEFRSTSDIGMKTILAHALGQSGRQEAMDELIRTVRDGEIGFFERRVASHGLAFSDDDRAVPVLEELARGDSERGVRANAAFGLARRGSEEGIRLYAKATDEAFAAKDPAAAQYLSGFYLLGKRALPVVRERLETYEDRQARLVLIKLVEDKKDRESLPVLYRIVNDASEDTSVQTAARQAIEKIEKQ